MEEILYLETDEEITSVVDKLKGLEAKSVGLVAPKGSTIAQSLVSLKLLKKEAEKLGKTVSLVTSDEVGQNLAAQIGLAVYRDVKSSRPINVPELEHPEEKPLKIDMTKAAAGATADEAGFKVHRYDEGEALEGQTAEKAAEANEEKPPEEKPQTPAKETFIKRPVGEEFTAKGTREELESARSVRDEGFKTSKKGLSKKKLWLLISGGIVLFMALVLAADFFLSKFTVKLIVQADQIEKDADITVEKDRPQVDFDNALIPGTKISKEKTFEDTFNSSGEKDVGQKAKGTLTFKNEAGTDESISAGTKVTSSGGLDFTLDSNITVPKATIDPAPPFNKVLGSTTGAITAKENGSKYNLPSSTTYIVSGKSNISASGSTSGGVTKTVKVVTKSDLEKAKNQLKAQDASKFLEPADQAKGEVYLDGASNIELLEFTSSKNAGDEADSFTGKAKLKFEVISFKNEDFRQAVIKTIEKTIPTDKGLLIESSDTITPTLKENNINLGKLIVSGKLKTHLGPKIDIPKLTRSWRLKTLKKVRESLNIPGVTIDSIDMKPSFSLPLAPARQSNIKIELEYTQSGNPQP